MTFDELCALVHELLREATFEEELPGEAGARIEAARRREAIAAAELVPLAHELGQATGQRGVVQRRIERVRASIAGAEAERLAVAEQLDDAEALATMGHTVTDANEDKRRHAALSRRVTTLNGELKKVRAHDAALLERIARVQQAECATRARAERARSEAQAAWPALSARARVRAMHRGGDRVTLVDAQREGEAWVAWLQDGAALYRVASWAAYTAPGEAPVERRHRADYVGRGLIAPADGRVTLDELASILERSRDGAPARFRSAHLTHTAESGQPRYQVVVAHGQRTQEVATLRHYTDLARAAIA